MSEIKVTYEIEFRTSLIFGVWWTSRVGLVHEESARELLALEKREKPGTEFRLLKVTREVV